MMQWQDIRLQLIDTPPITVDYFEGYIQSMVHSADGVLLLIDLGDDDGPFAAEAVVERLAQTKTVLAGQLPIAVEDPGIQHVKALVLANKIDLPGAGDRLEIVKELFGSRFPVYPISAEAGAGMGELPNLLYETLRIIRIYTKQPGKPPDMESPFTCPIGSTVHAFAGLVHQDFIEGLKSARIWGTGVYDGQTVKRDHVLHDKDIVELHL